MNSACKGTNWHSAGQCHSGIIIWRSCRVSCHALIIMTECTDSLLGGGIAASLSSRVQMRGDSCRGFVSCRAGCCSRLLQRLLGIREGLLCLSAAGFGVVLRVFVAACAACLCGGLLRLLAILATLTQSAGMHMLMTRHTAVSTSTSMP